MSDILVLGALHLDVIVDAPRLPRLDETLMGSDVAYRFGGKGGNQALAAARMGADVALAGAIGTDQFGQNITATLDHAQVDQSQLQVLPGATGMSVAIIDASGDYGAVVVSGVNRAIDPAYVDPTGAAVLLLQNEIPEAVNISVARRARSATLILNAAPARDVDPELYAMTDILVVNRVEAAQITGMAAEAIKAREALKVACALGQLGPRIVIVTLGGDGAVLWDGSTISEVTPPLRAKGSTHGAGDAFVGALAAEVARGCTIVEAVNFAAIAAAHFVATPPKEREAITRDAVTAWAATL